MIFISEKGRRTEVVKCKNIFCHFSKRLLSNKQFSLFSMTFYRVCAKVLYCKCSIISDVQNCYRKISHIDVPVTACRPQGGVVFSPPVLLKTHKKEQMCCKGVLTCRTGLRTIQMVPVNNSLQH